MAEPGRRPDIVEVRRTADVAVLRSECAGGPTDVEVEPSWQLVVCRRGIFRRETAEGVAVVDATTVYVGRPGQHQQVHHLDGHGDAAHVIAFSDRLAGPDADRLPTMPVRLPPAVDVRVRTLAADARRGADPVAVDEAAANLLGQLVEVTAGPVGPAPRADRRRAVGRVRERVGCEIADGRRPARLVELAADVGYAPHHLSRVFVAVTGTTISRSRRSLRARLALARIEDGADDLAAVAADVGFADHSHLVRALRADFGTTPTVLRRLVAPDPI